MKPIPIVYVTEMDRSLRWYRTVVPEADVVTSSPYWTELSIDGAALALHHTEAVSAGEQLGLAFRSTMPLEDLVAALAAAEITPVRDIADEPFGRSLVIQDPDGLRIQVNEHDPERYPT